MEKLVNIAAPVFVIGVLILLDLSSAAEYNVGHNFGWSYDSKTFHVGDVLVLEYSPLTTTSWRWTKPDTTGASLLPTRIYKSGNDRITLISKGTKYYICEYHCNFANQKLMIHVH